MSRLEILPGLVIAAAEIEESASRAGGPGGQHVNKTSTRVTLRWNVETSQCLDEAQRRRLLRQLEGRITRAGDLVVHARQQRSRARNRELARERLAELVRAGLARRRHRVATRPSTGARKRRLEAKRRRSDLKRGRRQQED